MFKGQMPNAGLNYSEAEIRYALLKAKHRTAVKQRTSQTQVRKDLELLLAELKEHEIFYSRFLRILLAAALIVLMSAKELGERAYFLAGVLGLYSVYCVFKRIAPMGLISKVEHYLDCVDGGQDAS